MFYCCGITDKGVMSHNEDALLIGGKVCTDGSCIEKLRAPFIIAVSDGVSGELSGEVASKMGLENIAEISYSSATDLRGELSGIHRMIAEYSAGQPETRNMQATLPLSERQTETAYQRPVVRPAPLRGGHDNP